MDFRIGDPETYIFPSGPIAVAAHVQRADV